MLFSLLAPLAFSAAVPDVQINHIVGGTPVSPPFKYPWLVSLTDSSHFCGGNLLDATTVVTAAHCSVGLTPKKLTALAHRHDLGQNATSENGLVFQVKKITIHPGYSVYNKAYDVAVWKVELVSGDASEIPAGVVSLDDGSTAAPGTSLSIAGWGTIYAGGMPSKIQLETSVNVLDDFACKQQYIYLDSTSICAAASGKDTCQGDSGGPLFSQMGGKITLVGLTSYGYGCASARYAGVYSRVSTFADWIKAEQQKSEFDEEDGLEYDSSSESDSSYESESSSE